MTILQNVLLILLVGIPPIAHFIVHVSKDIILQTNNWQNLECSPVINRPLQSHRNMCYIGGLLICSCKQYSNQTASFWAIYTTVYLAIRGVCVHGEVPIAL